VKRLVELGVTLGIGEELYGPGNPVTRAQMAVFLARAFLGMEEKKAESEMMSFAFQEAAKMAEIC